MDRKEVLFGDVNNINKFDSVDIDLYYATTDHLDDCYE